MANENIGALTQPLGDIIAEERLREIPGVGDAIADIIVTLYKTGTHPSLEKMRRDVPSGVLELLTVPGLRPDKILKLYKELDISSVQELEEAARSGRLASIKGLGASLQNKILRGIEVCKSARGQLHLHRAAKLLAAFENNLKRSHPDVVSVTPAGDFRRRASQRPVRGCNSEAKAKARRPETWQWGQGASYRQAPLRSDASVCDGFGEAHPVLSMKFPLQNASRCGQMDCGRGLSASRAKQKKPSTIAWPRLDSAGAT